MSHVGGMPEAEADERHQAPVAAVRRAPSTPTGPAGRRRTATYAVAPDDVAPPRTPAAIGRRPATSPPRAAERGDCPSTAEAGEQRPGVTDHRRAGRRRRVATTARARRRPPDRRRHGALGDVADEHRSAPAADGVPGVPLPGVAITDWRSSTPRRRSRGRRRYRTEQVAVGRAAMPDQPRTDASMSHRCPASVRSTSCASTAPRRRWPTWQPTAGTPARRPRVWRLLGTGRGMDTGPSADLRRTALFAVGRDEADLDRSSPARRWPGVAHAEERGTCACGDRRPRVVGRRRRARRPGGRGDDGPIAVVTRADVRVRPGGRSVPPVLRSAPSFGAPGLLAPSPGSASCRSAGSARSACGPASML